MRAKAEGQQQQKAIDCAELAVRRRRCLEVLCLLDCFRVVLGDASEDASQWVSRRVRRVSLC